MNNIELKIRLARSLIEEGELSFWDYLMGTAKDRVEVLAERYGLVMDYVWDIAEKDIDKATCTKLINDIGLASAVHQATSVQMLQDFSVAALTPQKIKDFKDAAIQRISIDQVNKVLEILREASHELDDATKRKAMYEAVFSDYNAEGWQLGDGTIGSIRVKVDSEWQTLDVWGMAGIDTNGDLI